METRRDQKTPRNPLQILRDNTRLFFKFLSLYGTLSSSQDAFALQNLTLAWPNMNMSKCYPVDIIDSDGVPVSVVQSGRMLEYNSWDISAQRKGKLNLAVEQLQGEKIIVFVVTAVVQQQAVFRPCSKAGNNISFIKLVGSLMCGAD